MLGNGIFTGDFDYDKSTIRLPRHSTYILSESLILWDSWMWESCFYTAFTWFEMVTFLTKNYDRILEPCIRDYVV